jgi:hypothetical protein
MATALQTARNPRTTEKELRELLGWCVWCRDSYKPLTKAQRAGLDELERATNRALDRTCNGR